MTKIRKRICHHAQKMHMSDRHDPSECGKYARLRSQIITRRDDLWEGMYSLDASRTKVSRRYADNILELQRQRSAHQQANQQTKPQQEWDLSNKLQVRVGLGQDRLDDDDDEYGERLEQQLSSFDDHHPPSDPIERIEREISMEEARFDTQWKLISSEMLEVKAKIKLLEDILREDYDGNYAEEEEEESEFALPSCDRSLLCAGRGELYEAEEEEELFIEPIDSDTDPIGSEVSTLTLDSEGEDFAKAPCSEGQVSIEGLWGLFTPTLDLEGEAFIEALDSDGEDFTEALGPKGGVSPMP